MYTFSQLLMRNTVLGLFFCLSISALGLFLLSEFLEEVQSQHQQSVIAISKQLSDTPKELADTLMKSSDYNILLINNLQGDNLFSYSKNVQDFSLPFIEPDMSEVALKSNNITIKFKLNTNEQLSFVVTLLGSTFLLIAIFIGFASYSTLRHNRLFFAAINNQIKKDLSLIDPNSKQVDTSNDLINIPELKEGIGQIKKLIEAQIANSSTLEKEAYTDKLTQLDNRNKFVQFYETVGTKESAVKFGVLIITRCSELQTVNQIHGYNEGDNYIVNVANILNSTITPYKGSVLCRLNSSDFASILPNITLKDAENFAKELTSRFNEFQQASDLDSVAYSGLVYFDQNKPLGELLALADTGISIAQTQSINAWYIQKDADGVNKNDINQGNQNWRQEIDNVIANQRISLLVQPIQPSTRNTKVYGEILARFLNSNDEMLPTASFIAMAEKLDRISAIDKLIVETVIREITSKNIIDSSFGINISARSITDEQFLVWLERRLLREPTIAPRLIFEISEYGLQQNIKTSKRFIDMIHRVGSRVTVERFGVGLTSFKFFRDLKPDFIKMDSTYTRDIDDDKNNQYFLRLMVDLAHRLSINVLAESVESQEEKHTLERLFIDGCQGFYVGKPKPL